jgi:hypothetical protein
LRDIAYQRTNFAAAVNEEVRLVGISTGSYPSVGLRVRVHGRRIAVSFVIRAYSKLEDGTSPTSPASSGLLLEAYRRGDGRRWWSGVELERATGSVVTRSYVTNLRKGRIENPGMDKLWALASRRWASPPLSGSRRN